MKKIAILEPTGEEGAVHCSAEFLDALRGWSVYVCVCVCVYVCACVCVCTRVCMCVCARVGASIRLSFSKIAILEPA